jgi:hypothetical protein
MRHGLVEPFSLAKLLEILGIELGKAAMFTNVGDKVAGGGNPNDRTRIWRWQRRGHIRLDAIALKFHIGDNFG